MVEDVYSALQGALQIDASARQAAVEKRAAEAKLAKARDYTHKPMELIGTTTAWGLAD